MSIDFPWDPATGLKNPGRREWECLWDFDSDLVRVNRSLRAIKLKHPLKHERKGLSLSDLQVSVVNQCRRTLIK